MTEDKGINFVTDTSRIYLKDHQTQVGTHLDWFNIIFYWFPGSSKSNFTDAFTN